MKPQSTVYTWMAGSLYGVRVDIWDLLKIKLEENQTRKELAGSCTHSSKSMGFTVTSLCLGAACSIYCLPWVCDACPSTEPPPGISPPCPSVCVLTSSTELISLGGHHHQLSVLHVYCKLTEGGSLHQWLSYPYQHRAGWCSSCPNYNYKIKKIRNETRTWISGSMPVSACVLTSSIDSYVRRLQINADGKWCTAGDRKMGRRRTGREMHK